MLNDFRVERVDRASFAASAGSLWPLLCRPEIVARHTPFVRSVADLGDGRWRWEIAGIGYPGGRFGACFTERMLFERPDCISFRHDPGGSRELAGADGTYRLRPAPDGGGTVLELFATTVAWLPVPRFAGAAVRATMDLVTAQMIGAYTTGLRAELQNGTP